MPRQPPESPSDVRRRPGTTSPIHGIPWSGGVTEKRPKDKDRSARRLRRRGRRGGLRSPLRSPPPSGKASGALLLALSPMPAAVHPSTHGCSPPGVARLPGRTTPRGLRARWWGGQSTTSRAIVTFQLPPVALFVVALVGYTCATDCRRAPPPGSRHQLHFGSRATCAAFVCSGCNFPPPRPDRQPGVEGSKTAGEGGGGRVRCRAVSAPC